MADQFNILDQSRLDWDPLTSGEETFSRRDILSNSLTMTSGTVFLSYFTARKQEPISQVRVATGGTAAGATPTLIRVGIWRSDNDGALLELLASTANDTALLAGTFTEYAKALSAPFTKQYGMRLACGLLVVTGATAPTMMAASATPLSGQTARSPRLHGRVTGQTDLPSTVAAGSITAQTHGPYAELLP